MLRSRPANSQSSPDFPTFDDFISLTTLSCPAGETWNVDSIDADGIPSIARRSAFPTISMSSSTPTARAFLAHKFIRPPNSPFVEVGSTYTINLAAPRSSLQGRIGIASRPHDLYWQWRSGAGLTGPCSPTMVQPGKTPAVASGSARLGQDKLICIPTAGGPDQVYRLNGTTGGGACTNYTFTSGADAIVPGDTDTGVNHDDDVDTVVGICRSHSSCMIRPSMR